MIPQIWDSLHLQRSATRHLESKYADDILDSSKIFKR